MSEKNLDHVKGLSSNKHQRQCWKVLKSAPCPDTPQHILYISFLRQRRFCVLLCYLSCAWGWEWRRALTLGRHLCAVDHDSVRVWLRASLQSKPYLSPLPVSRLLEGAPDPPTKALQEGCSGCGGGRQLCDGKRHNIRGHPDSNMIVNVSVWKKYGEDLDFSTEISLSLK